MKLTIFQSQQGDSILISSQNKHILVDGGMSSSYSEHVVPTLSNLNDNGEKLDLVCVSHIDQDHIQGILKMLNDEMDWRVYEFHKANGNNRVRKPKSKRPPEISQIWHNAFHEQVLGNTGPIEDMLAAFAVIFDESETEDLLNTGLSEYATSIRQAILLSRRIQAKQLNIPLNQDFDGKLITVEQANGTISIGDMDISIIGPRSEDMEELRDKWNDWLEDNEKNLGRIQRNAIKDEKSIGNEAIPWLNTLLQAKQILGQRKNVTLPNLASVMFLLEASGNSILMTGDGHWKDILIGLELKGKLSTEGSIHVDVLKVQHHGSEHNLNDEFCKQLTADHYIFCGDGSHHNPDLRVIQAIIDSRVSNGDQRAITNEVGNDFTLWFNSSEDATRKKNKHHMEKLEDLVKGEARRHSQIEFKFMNANKSKLEIDL